MNREYIQVLIIRFVSMLPKLIQKSIFKSIIETRYLIFRIKYKLFSRNENLADPGRIYWITTDRIVRCISPEDRKGFFSSRKIRGKVVGGDWDLTNYEFAKTIDVYEAFKKRINEKVDWKDTEYYKRILGEVKSGNFIYGIRNEHDLDERCKYLDSLYETIKKEGYHLNRYNYIQNVTFNEIDVNIGRTGEYIFRDGIHRLSIAKILALKYVPVTVCVRHKNWQEFRDFLFFNSEKLYNKRLFKPLVHPDLVDIPIKNRRYNPENLWKAIKFSLEKDAGAMLEIGAKIGFWCHKFEDLGYDCYAVEQDPELFYIMQKIKVAEKKKFKIINRSILDVGFIQNIEFDVVLALDVFYHFLKTKKMYFQLINLLKNLKTKQFFFGLHNFEDSMKNINLNYTETQFVDFLLQNTDLTKSELIHKNKNGSHFFKLFK